MVDLATGKNGVNAVNDEHFGGTFEAKSIVKKYFAKVRLLILIIEKNT